MERSNEVTNKELFKLYEELKDQVETLGEGGIVLANESYKVKDAAKILGMSLEGTYKLIRKGRLPSVKTNITRIRAKDLKAFMEGNIN